MNVDGAVETWWTTTSETIFPESLGRLFFDVFVASETGEVEAGEVRNCFARPDEFGFGTRWTRDDGEGGKVETLSFGEGLFQWFWGPFVNEFIDFLVIKYRLGYWLSQETAYTHLF